jgi:uncharacterized protein YegP (UPF0339 family)
MAAARILYTRADGKWAWRLEADNGGILAADGGQGYESEADARSMADRVIAGDFRDADRKITVRRHKRIDERLVENIADGLRLQASAQAITASESLYLPIEDLPPSSSEAERRLLQEQWGEHPGSRPTADQLGPWTVPVNFSGPTPVGGWAQLMIHRSGYWSFSGELHDFGLPSYEHALVFIVKSLGTDDVYQFAHQGRMRGALEAGDRHDRWDDSGTCFELAGEWNTLFSDGYHWHCRAGINVDVNSVVGAAHKAVGMPATVISIV